MRVSQRRPEAEGQNARACHVLQQYVHFTPLSDTDYENRHGRENHLLEFLCPKLGREILRRRGAGLVVLRANLIFFTVHRPVHLLNYRFYTKLVMLDLSHNEIVAVQDSSFTRSFNLKDLNLEGNKIFKVTNRTFVGLCKLQSLNLRKNEITSLPPGVFFSNMQALISLDLGGNRITYISDTALHGKYITKICIRR